MNRTASLLAALSLLTFGCNKGPEKLPPKPQNPPAASGGAPHGPMGSTSTGGQAGPVHGGVGTQAGEGEPLWAGSIELRGELSSREDGSLFVVVRPPGGGMPLVVRKFDLADAPPAPEGQLRHVSFRLASGDAMFLASPPPEVCDMEVYFDPDGVVETKEGRVGGTVQVNKGDLGLHLSLDPATNTLENTGGH